MSAPRRDYAYWIGFVVVVALLWAAPLVLPGSWGRFATEILIWGLLAMSSDILIGYTGMVSFGHSVFFGLGMYGAAAALLSVKPPNLWLALAYGLVAAAVVSAFVAYFARTKQRYAAAVTMTWVGVNLLNVARYIGDARAQNLPLLGGEDSIHDWWYLLINWDLLPRDTVIARWVHFFGVVAFLTSMLGGFMTLKASGRPSD